MIETLTNLLPHQIPAVEKLKPLKIGALYMEMGTGKTRTALELIKLREQEGKVEKVLWLCPCSVKENLRRDLIKHCGDIPEEIQIAGIESLSSSDKLFLELLDYVKSSPTYLIVDESNLIKNPLAKRSKRITNIAESCDYKMILNGTPISKNYADLFGQWYILDWQILGFRSYYSFAANHLVFKEIDGRRTNQVIRVLNTDHLTKCIEPFTYQVKKEECFKLPAKRYREKSFWMTSSQTRHYEDVKDRYLFEIDEMREETVYKFFSALQHVTSGKLVVSEPIEKMETEPFFDDYRDNPRMQALEVVLATDIKNEKCIIFAKYQDEINDILRLCESRGMKAAEFTGRISQKKRQEKLKSFLEDTQVLVANKACGAYGLNLQHCRNIIFYNNDFDLATRLQAEDRIHRLGQERDCNIYDIVARETIDEFVSGNLGDKESMLRRLKEEIKRLKEEKENAKNISGENSLRSSA